MVGRDANLVAGGTCLEVFLRRKSRGTYKFQTWFKRRTFLFFGVSETRQYRRLPNPQSHFVVLDYAPMRMVFADDSDIVRTLIKRSLIESDPTWEIEEARTGKEAIEKTRTTKPHLVLLDVNLPDIQGTEVAKLIREALPTVKIVLCSLGDAQDAMAAVKACGADAYVSKVAPMKEFHKTLAALIDNTPPELRI